MIRTNNSYKKISNRGSKYAINTKCNDISDIIFYNKPSTNSKEHEVANYQCC